MNSSSSQYYVLRFCTQDEDESERVEELLAERVEAFGFETTEIGLRMIHDAEMGLGESRLHLEGKRDKDVQRDAELRRDNKRKNREAAVPSETKRRKEATAKKRQEKMKTFSSVEKVAKLCSGEERCCAERCLEVSCTRLYLKELNNQLVNDIFCLT